MDSHPPSKIKKDPSDAMLLPEGTLAVPLDFAQRWLKRWWAIALALFLLTGVSGGFGAWLLLQQSANPNCQFVFWPFASASLRLYCAQELAAQKTLEGLFDAIALIDGLPQEHPLRLIINRRVEEWSKQALDLAEEEFHQGKLARAIDFAKKIPTRTSAHRLVNQRIEYWQKIWALGEKTYQAAEAKLAQEDWRGAFGVMVQLLSLDNRYWAQGQYEKLNEIIMQAQKDETLLVKAERLLEAGGIENLAKSLNLLQDLSENTIYKKSIQKTTEKVGRALISIAENSLNRQELSDALTALEQIPKTVSFWPEVQDWIEISNAIADTWAGSVEGYESAIQQLQKIGTNRPLYDRAQQFIQDWMAEIQYVRTLEQAQAKAADGTVGSLSTAIAIAQQIPSSSQQWESAKQLIADWSTSIEVQQEPLATPFANSSPVEKIPDVPAAPEPNFNDPPLPPPPRSANQQVVSSPESAEQQLINDARRIAEDGTPQGLAAAIDRANQVSTRSSLRSEAELAMDTWGQRILDLAIQRSQSDRQGAIDIASQVPPSSSTYRSAQEQIRLWKSP
jgi:hypothetical protein